MGAGRILGLGVAAVLLVATFTAGTAATAPATLASSKVGQRTFAITPATLAPPQCAAIATGLANIQIVTAATYNAGNGNDLVLGRTAATTLNGQGGNDCIVGGPGNDIFIGGTGTDVCIGNGGTDSFTSCETQVQ